LLLGGELAINVRYVDGEDALLLRKQRLLVLRVVTHAFQRFEGTRLLLPVEHWLTVQIYRKPREDLRFLVEIVQSDRSDYQVLLFNRHGVLHRFIVVNLEEQ